MISVAGTGSRAQILAPVPVHSFLARAALTLLGVALLPLAAGAQTQDDPTAGLAGLSLPLGARAIGQGRAAAAMSGELQALAYNPAAIGGIGRGALTFSRFEAASDAGLDGNFLAAGASTRWGTFAVQALLVDYGDIAVTESSPEPIGTIEVSDWALGVTWAHRLREGVTLAGTAKWLSTGFGSLDASGPAFDAGAVVTLRSVPVSVGVAARNLGPDLEIGDGKERLPSRIRAGVRVHPAPFSGGAARVELAFDHESHARDLATSSQHAGAAVIVRESVAVRGGMVLLDDPYSAGGERNVGGSIGVGVRVGGLEADFAREISVSELGDETHISVGWRF